MQPRIATVLRSGGEFTVDHVERLRDQCARHAHGVPFICLSDVTLLEERDRIPLVHDWPGWWAKMELFRLSGPVLYMDLDTSVVGDLSPLLEVSSLNRFTVLRDLNPSQRVMGSGLMAWSGSMLHLYSAFAADAKRHMADCNSPRWHGDQGFIERHTTDREYWQDALPGAVVSWKKHCASGVPDDARVVCFHGKPRPWEVGQ